MSVVLGPVHEKVEHRRSVNQEDQLGADCEDPFEGICLIPPDAKPEHAGPQNVLTGNDAYDHNKEC
ncbi:MAG TPA: hypothetical protein VJV22_21470, partial [Acidobacteriaceae bacterium]|nr:hypothetical protein [Acidobacteriaceae bacterium]